MISSAYGDFRSGLLKFDIWSTLSWIDIKQRYRRSVIGPFWITISTIINVLALGYLYSYLFNYEVSNYIEYLAIGLILWGYISSVFNEASTVFVTSETMIKQIKLPYSTYVFRLIYRNLLILLHSLVLLIFYNLISLRVDLLHILLAMFSLLLLSLVFFNIGIILGVLGARFRDIVPLVANVMQLFFFVTPVMWSLESLPKDNKLILSILYLNPFYHLIEIVRRPLMGQFAHLSTYAFVFVTLLVTHFLAIIAFGKYHKKISYWL